MHGYLAILKIPVYGFHLKNQVLVSLSIRVSVGSVGVFTGTNLNESVATVHYMHIFRSL